MQALPGVAIWVRRVLLCAQVLGISLFGGVVQGQPAGWPDVAVPERSLGPLAFLYFVNSAPYTWSAAAIVPLSGNWWNPDESGTGYAIDVKNGILVMTTYSYNVDGSAQWYLSAGQLVNNTATMTLDAYRSGQCIACPYTGRPVLAGSAGTATVRFSSSTSAILQLPGGRSIAIRPLDFGGGPSTQ